MCEHNTAIDRVQNERKFHVAPAHFSLHCLFDEAVQPTARPKQRSSESGGTANEVSTANLA